MEETLNTRLGELILEVAKGDLDALDEIAERMNGILKTVGNAYYKNKADVEDAIHDLYVSLREKACYFRKNSNACAWLIKIFENSIRSHLRRLRRSGEVLQDSLSVSILVERKKGEMYLENHLFIQEMFDELTKEEQRIVLFYYWCGLTVRDIAALLHKSKSTISNKLLKLAEKIKNL